MPDWMAQAVVVAATALAVAGAVLVHFEGLVLLGRYLTRLPSVAHRPGRGGRVTMLQVIAGLLVLHILEIWLFGATFWALQWMPGAGGVDGAPPTLLASVYLSATTYTTVGFGDVAPVGALRFLAGTESLVGLVLITWSGSFTFVEMSRYWRDDAP